MANPYDPPPNVDASDEVVIAETTESAPSLMWFASPIVVLCWLASALMHLSTDINGLVDLFLSGLLFASMGVIPALLVFGGVRLAFQRLAPIASTRVSLAICGVVAAAYISTLSLVLEMWQGWNVEGVALFGVIAGVPLAVLLLIAERAWLGQPSSLLDADTEQGIPKPRPASVFWFGLGAMAGMIPLIVDFEIRVNEQTWRSVADWQWIARTIFRDGPLICIILFAFYAIASRLWRSKRQMPTIYGRVIAGGISCVGFGLTLEGFRDRHRDSEWWLVVALVLAPLLGTAVSLVIERCWMSRTVEPPTEKRSAFSLGDYQPEK